MECIFDIETIGLEPFSDKIICISLFLDNKTITFASDDEKQILQDFFKAINDVKVLIGYNIDSFDIPFLIKRALIHGVKVTFLNKKIIDLRKTANGFFYCYDKYGKGTLRQWADILGYKTETSNGEQMPTYYNNNEWNKIKEHCEEDIKITKSLYDRCLSCGLIS